ncbi:glutaminyl-peptide cyclotransferase-like protein isoform X3 [Ciconia boyciana]|uniref:glutaminyl-peptide cyclotransferase-like protein isoform X3 n=1 Tax=Ciconia boyciana TaxID=52775 RepID=UPI003BA0EAFF
MRKGAGGSRRARAAGSGPGPGPVAVLVPVPGPGLCPRSRRCPRPLLPLLALAAAAALLYVAWPGGERGTGPSSPSPLSEPALRALLGRLDPTRLRDTFLRPLLRERVPGGAGSRAARQHIVGHLSALGAAWHLELDTFEAVTPRGLVTFTNVVATVAPAAPRRLVLACHYDTKVLPPGPGQQLFLGATDSAVPCAILLELAAALDRPLLRTKDRDTWVPHLGPPHPGHLGPLLDARVPSLLPDAGVPAGCGGDTAAAVPGRGGGLRGLERHRLPLWCPAPGGTYGRHPPRAPRHPDHCHKQQLRRLGLLHAPRQDQPFFRLSLAPGPVEDDHVPFLQRGVPVLHLIPTPFPRVWHTLEDTEDNLHPPTMEDLCKILVTFVAEFLQL